MVFFRRLIDAVTLGSDRPIQRLAAYYAALGIVAAALLYTVPAAQRAFFGIEAAQASSTPTLLQDGLAGAAPVIPDARANLDLTVRTLMCLLVTLALMLPVSWVYMSTGSGRTHNQSTAQTLLVLPLVVAGIVLVVQNSLALAFSLAGVVAAVRFRASLSDTRDVVFIFLAIAVGFAAGVQMLMIAVLLSVVINIILLAISHYDFGRNVLAPTASAALGRSLTQLASVGSNGTAVPDRDLVVALTPKKAEALSRQFHRVRETLGTKGQKPRYDGIVSVATGNVTEAQRHVEDALGEVTKRWKLDEVVANDGKPSQLFYLVRSRKRIPRDAIVTAIRNRSNGSVDAVDVEIGAALAEEKAEQKELRKMQESS